MTEPPYQLSPLIPVSTPLTVPHTVFSSQNNSPCLPSSYPDQHPPASSSAPSLHLAAVSACHPLLCLALSHQKTSCRPQTLYWQHSKANVDKRFKKDGTRRIQKKILHPFLSPIMHQRASFSAVCAISDGRQVQPHNSAVDFTSTHLTPWSLHSGL